MAEYQDTGMLADWEIQRAITSAKSAGDDGRVSELEDEQAARTLVRKRIRGFDPLVALYAHHSDTMPRVT